VNPPDNQAPCPACGELVDVPEAAVLGEAVWCPACGAELEVVSTQPASLLLYEEEEK
jgi:lysine biosynthesis protein LysW